MCECLFVSLVKTGETAEFFLKIQVLYHYMYLNFTFGSTHLSLLLVERTFSCYVYSGLELFML